jgi:hypothetical protein
MRENGTAGVTRIQETLTRLLQELGSQPLAGRMTELPKMPKMPKVPKSNFGSNPILAILAILAFLAIVPT